MRQDTDMMDEHPVDSRISDSSRVMNATSSDLPQLACWLRELGATVVPAIVIVLSINLLLAQPRVVHGQSMEPSLHESQRVIVDLLAYRLRTPRYGEIVVLDVPERESGPPLIKRVIGLPGDVVEIKGGSVYVNGHKLVEPYLDQITTGALGSTLVPEEHVFVLGDNRRSSNDSRYFGTVPFESILGRAWMTYWPPAEVGFFE
ncbi:MAG: signal peptidase I [Anaerolineae bacterium]|nr:signal peptidase I [Anaerolineae bacterium]